MPLAIIKVVLRLYAVVLFVTLSAITGCRNRLESKEKVQEAILQRLQTRSGLDVKSLDVNTTAVSFDKNKAYATVSIHPKSDPSVNGALIMNYTLEQRNGKWEVVNVGGPHGSPMTGHGGSAPGQLPPGHPSIDSGSQGRSQ